MWIAAIIEYLLFIPFIILSIAFVVIAIIAIKDLFLDDDSYDNWWKKST